MANQSQPPTNQTDTKLSNLDGQTDRQPPGGSDRIGKMREIKSQISNLMNKIDFESKTILSTFDDAQPGENGLASALDNEDKENYGK